MADAIHNHGSWLTVPTGMFMAWSSLTFFVRTWAKLRTKTWGLDDWLLTSALLVIIAHVGITYRSIELGYGRSLADIPENDTPSVEKMVYATDMLHMAYSGPHTRPACFLAFSSGVWAAGSIIAIGIRSDSSRPWATLDGTEQLFIRWMVIEVIGIMVEVAIWLLAAHLVWTLQMQLRKRIYILSAFGFRLFLVVFIALRLTYLAPSQNTDPTFSNIVPSIFTQATLHFSIIAACVTTLKPFLRHFDPTYVIGSGTLSTSKRSRVSTTNPSRDPYYRLNPVNGTNRSGRSNRSRDPENDITWRPYQGPTGNDGHAMAYHPTNTATQSTTSSKAGRLSRLSKALSGGLRSASQSKQSSFNRSVSRDEESTGTDASDRIIIERTTEVTVEHELSKPRPTHQ
ncbi:hypothetical protein NLG97_g9291 [Lecanicillium saksenae]|uniref:Uncharacterized protein n=1 Tax=Lecanicillium saksenae TaxID=468837 RepID=A0ACC1QGM5_9HYPO|nr:hypothetical protein NLG97_g9291 [Lecanicillium saksenae]